MSNATREIVHRDKVMVELIKSSEYQKDGTETAQLRQKLTKKSYYPSKQANNSFTDSVFDNSDFGYEEQMFESVENRVAFLNVPAGISSEDVQKKIDTNTGACLYKILSNRPILTDSQKYSISQGLRTMDDFANSQAVRYSKESDQADELVTDNNDKVQYRAVFFSKTAKNDVDLRTSDPADQYLSPELRAELTGVVEDSMEQVGLMGQTI